MGKLIVSIGETRGLKYKALSSVWLWLKSPLFSFCSPNRKHYVKFDT